MSRADFPSPEEGLALHQRLLSDDPWAPSDACAAYLDPLAGWLESHFRGIDPDLIASAAHDALFVYVQQPEKYHPDQSDLAAYLRLSARGDLLNLLQKESKHTLGKISLESVELSEEAGKLCCEEEPAALLARRETVAGVWEQLAHLRAICTPHERAALDLMLEGEHRTEAFAVVLGLEGQPLSEQETQVKRVKDRIKKRLMRGGNDHE